MTSAIMDSLFQRTLGDLVEGLRVQMIGESKYIANHLEEIRKEIKSTDAHTKTVALQKLTYINMLHGVDMEWAAFHVVEAMSMSKYAHKKTGYLAASCSFHEGTDVLLLITNQLRKDLSSNNEYEVGLALACLSCIATPDLAQELTLEVFSLMASGRLYVRSRATLSILKLFTKYPDAVRIACKRLVEKLEDSDCKVISASVSVFCEMSMKDPASCIPLAPEFYRLLVDSKDNWLLIKVVKIFGVLAPLEPRLGRKIAEPLCDLMRNTVAKSLLLECVRTVIVGLPTHTEAMKLAVQKLKELLEEDDPNLKYLGLQVLAMLMPAHPWAVAENKSIVVRGLNDDDPTIQMASLQLILGMVSEDNLIDTVQVLLQYAERSDISFSNELVGAILATCSRGLYELVPDFSWYISVLGRIARIVDSSHGKELERQFVDIGIRVKEVRGDLLAVARGILLDPTLLEYPSLYRVLSAVAWIAGEYVEFSQSAFELVEALLQPRTKLLPPSVQAVYLQSVLKVFVYLSFMYLKNECTEEHAVIAVHSSAEEEIVHSSVEEEIVCSMSGSEGKEVSFEGALVEASVSFVNRDDGGMVTTQGTFHDKDASKFSAQADENSLDRLMDLIEANVGPMAERKDVEVQERACNILGVAKALKDTLVPADKLENTSSSPPTKRAFEMIKVIRGVFTEELGPVSVFAQSRMAMPDGLVLETNLNSLDALFCEEEVLQDEGKELITAELNAREWEVGPIDTLKAHDNGSRHGESSSLLAQHRLRHGTYYLPVEKDSAKADDYPPPRLTQLDAPSTSSASMDIMKLAENSSLWTRARQARARPVVVRLDDADEDLLPSNNAKKELKDDLLSNALKDALRGAESKQPTKSATRESVLDGVVPSQHRKGHHHDKNGTGEAIEGVSDALQEGEERSTRKHRKHRHTRHSSTKAHHDGGGESSGRDVQGRPRHSSQRSRHKAKSPVNVFPQTPVIPDFLL